MRTLSFLLWFATAVASHALAEEGAPRICGSVTDAATGQPLRDVAVTALDPASGEETVVVTDVAGDFALPVAPGVYVLVVEGGGYQRHEERDVDVRAGAERIDIKLTPEVLEAEVVIDLRCHRPIDTTSSTVRETFTDEFRAFYPLR